MIRIGIIGSENSHAEKFSELANLEKPSCGERIPGVQVAAIYGTDRGQAQQVAHKCRIPQVVDAPEAMLGQVDAVMITARHGDSHSGYALPFIEAGIPTFVDKPFAISLEDCYRMIETAERRGTPLTSYSTLRYTNAVQKLQSEQEELGQLAAGVSTGPCDFSSEYGGPFFYGTHAIETMLAVFGHDVCTVRAQKVGPNCTAVVEYESGCLVNLNLLANATYVFHIAAYGTKGWRSVPIDLVSCYENGFRVFLHMVKTGKQPLTFQQLLDPIRILHGVLKSLETGRRVEIAG